MGYPGDLLSRPVPTAADRHDRPASPVNEREAPRLRWVPIRSLAPRHRDRIAAHLLGLSRTDRYLRFGYAATDEQIQAYVDKLDFDRDEVFGIFNRRLTVIAMAHLAYDGQPQTPAQPAGRPRMAEFGVSVSTHARGRGYGAQLFDHAAMHARNRGIQTLFIHALSENTAMLAIARKAGASVERDGGESQAYLKLPAATMASIVEEFFEGGAAEADYEFKRQAQRLGTLFGTVREQRENDNGSRHDATS